MSDSLLTILKHPIPAETLKPSTDVASSHKYLPSLVCTEILFELNYSEQGHWTTDLKSLAAPGSLHLICVYLNITFNKIGKALPPSVLS